MSVNDIGSEERPLGCYNVWVWLRSIIPEHVVLGDIPIFVPVSSPPFIEYVTAETFVSVGGEAVSIQHSPLLTGHLPEIDTLS